MTEPTQTCTTCGAVEIVRPDGRGFPPDIAKRKLAKRCKAAGHTSTPRYLAGLGEWKRNFENKDHTGTGTIDGPA